MVSDSTSTPLRILLVESQIGQGSVFTFTLPGVQVERPG